jgi:hypothetical protein
MLRSVAATLVVLALVLVAAARDTTSDKAKPAAKSSGGYVHVVLFTMKKDAPASAVEEVIKDCHKLLGKIAAVRSVKAGRPADQATPKVAKKNYDVALLVLVDDFEGLKSYLEDPKHLEFVKKHQKQFDIDRLQVFDFANQEK